MNAFWQWIFFPGWHIRRLPQRYHGFGHWRTPTTDGCQMWVPRTGASLFSAWSDLLVSSVLHFNPSPAIRLECDIRKSASCLIIWCYLMWHQKECFLFEYLMISIFLHFLLVLQFPLQEIWVALHDVRDDMLFQWARCLWRSCNHSDDLLLQRAKGLWKSCNHGDDMLFQRAKGLWRSCNHGDDLLQQAKVCEGHVTMVMTCCCSGQGVCGGGESQDGGGVGWGGQDGIGACAGRPHPGALRTFQRRAGLWDATQSHERFW